MSRVNGLTVRQVLKPVCTRAIQRSDLSRVAVVIDMSKPSTSEPVSQVSKYQKSGPGEEVNRHKISKNKDSSSKGNIKSKTMNNRFPNDHRFDPHGLTSARQAEWQPYPPRQQNQPWFRNWTMPPYALQNQVLNGNNYSAPVYNQPRHMGYSSSKFVWRSNRNNRRVGISVNKVLTHGFSTHSATQPALNTARPEQDYDFSSDTFETDYSWNNFESFEEGESSPREWEYTEYGRAHLHRPKPGVELTVLTYNVLSQQLLEDNSYLYTHCSPEVLQWENRKNKLLEEILTHKPNVICLQEVQDEHYKDFFLPHLTSQGYDGVFQKRTGSKPDGCAVFVLKEQLTLTGSFPVIYNRGNILDRDNVALIVKLKTSHGEKEAEVFIATTHLLFNPRRGDVKLAQLTLLFAELDHLASRHCSLSHNSYSPVILCGDFNAEPHSDIYKFIVQGYLRYHGLLCAKLSGQTEPNKGREFYLGKTLLPPHLKITDQCQFLQNLQRRNVHIPDKVSRKLSSLDSHQKDNSDQVVIKDASSDLPCEGTSTENDTTSGNPTNAPNENTSAVSYGTGCLWHKFNFLSAYKHTIERLAHTATEVTTQHQSASCTLDYIFYNVSKKRTNTKRKRVVTRDIEEDKLRLIGRYGLLSSREVWDMGGLPNNRLASDHLGLMAKFLLQT